MVDPGGRPIGRIEAIYLDYETDAPEWALVAQGRFGGRPTFVPLEGATAEAGAVRAPFDQAAVKDAPSVEPEEELSQASERALSRHYGLRPTPGSASSPTDARRSSGASADAPPGRAAHRADPEVTAGGTGTKAEAPKADTSGATATPEGPKAETSGATATPAAPKAETAGVKATPESPKAEASGATAIARATTDATTAAKSVATETKSELASTAGAGSAVSTEPPEPATGKARAPAKGRSAAAEKTKLGPAKQTKAVAGATEKIERGAAAGTGSKGQRGGAKRPTAGSAAKTKAEPATKAKPGSDAMAKAKPGSDAMAKAKAKAEAAAKAKTEAAAKAKTEAAAKAKTEAAAKAKNEAAVSPEERAEAASKGDLAALEATGVGVSMPPAAEDQPMAPADPATPPEIEDDAAARLEADARPEAEREADGGAQAETLDAGPAAEVPVFDDELDEEDVEDDVLDEEHLHRLEATRARYRVHAVTYDFATVAMEPARERAVQALGLQPGDVVLDVGCGTGNTFAAIERLVGPEGKILGLDLSAEMLVRARERADAAGWQNVQLLESSAEEVSVNGTVDAVLLVFAHDVLRSPMALERILRPLRPGGRVVATGAKWAPWWAPAVNSYVVTVAASFVSSFEGFDRPWTQLQRHVPDLRVEELAFGSSFLASGTIPEGQER